MSRRPNMHDLSKAEVTAKSQVRESPIGGAKAELLAKFGAMAESQAAHADRLRAQGIDVPEATHEMKCAWAEQWESEQIERVHEAQQRMIDRARGALPYVSSDPRHRAAQSTDDLRSVESAKLLLRIARRARRMLVEAQSP